MARGRRRLLLAAGVGLALAAATWAVAGRRDPVAILPSGASAAARGHGLARVAEAFERTRFAGALADSGLGSWLEQTATARALDSLRDRVRATTGLDLSRRALVAATIDEAAVALYGPASGEGPPRWVASSRLGPGAWAVAAAARIAAALGVGDFPRMRAAGRTLHVLPGGEEPLHVFVAGRLLVVGSDPDLVRAAAAIDAGAGSVAREPWFLSTRVGLPEGGNLLLVGRREALRGLGPLLPESAAAAGLRVLAGRSTEVHLFLPRSSTAPATSAAPPALALLEGRPLAFAASGGALPALLVDALDARRREASRVGTAPSAPLPPLGPGFAFAVTDADVKPGAILPLPRWSVVIGAPGPQMAAAALRRLYPPGARAARIGGIDVLATGESLLLAGSFELLGAAGPDRIVLASDPDLLAEALAAGPGTSAERLAPAPGVPVDAVAAIDMDKALPLLARWGPVLAGVLAARYPGLPDLAGDVGLLAAVRSVAVSSGAGHAGTLARLDLDLRDVGAGSPR